MLLVWFPSPLIRSSARLKVRVFPLFVLLPNKRQVVLVCLAVNVRDSKLLWYPQSPKDVNCPTRWSFPLLSQYGENSLWFESHVVVQSLVVCSSSQIVQKDSKVQTQTNIM